MTKPEHLTPFLVDAKQASRLLGIGLSLFYELNSTGQIPAPVKLHSRSLWSCDLLKLFANNGCPSRDSETWKKILQDEKITK